MLRYQYNYLLAARFDWWKYNRCDCVIPQGEFCQIACSIGSQVLRDNPDWHSQSARLPQLKQERPWYKEIYSQVLQDCVKRVKNAFDRYIQGDNKGKRSGKPRFKNKARYRTFTYPQVKQDCLQGNKVNLPKIGLVKFIQHRPIPEAMKIKTISVTKKADGYYVTFSCEDKSIPDFAPEITPSIDNSIAIDLGLEKLYVDSYGYQELPKKYYRKSQSKLTKLQHNLDDGNRSKKAKKLLQRQISKLHQKIARQRKQWHYESARRLCSQSDVIYIEDLKIANLKRKNKPKKDENGKYLPNGQSAKSGMNKSWSDCGIGQFVEILQQVAKKLGKLVIKVNPSGTSQHCHACLNHVPKELKDRWHECDCGESLDRDHNSALLIQKVGLGIASLKNA